MLLWWYLQGYQYHTLQTFSFQDPAFEDAITMALEDLEKERAIVWQAVFADTGRSQEEIQSWRQMLLITLRGLALTNIVAGKNEKVSLQIDQFKAMFKRYLTEA